MTPERTLYIAVLLSTWTATSGTCVEPRPRSMRVVLRLDGGRIPAIRDRHHSPVILGSIRYPTLSAFAKQGYVNDQLEAVACSAEHCHVSA